jgi:hypothetical protein
MENFNRQVLQCLLISTAQLNSRQAGTAAGTAAAAQGKRKFTWIKGTRVRKNAPLVPPMCVNKIPEHMTVDDMQSLREFVPRVHRGMMYPRLVAFKATHLEHVDEVLRNLQACLPHTKDPDLDTVLDGGRARRNQVTNCII